MNLSNLVTRAVASDKKGNTVRPLVLKFSQLHGVVLDPVFF